MVKLNNQLLKTKRMPADLALPTASENLPERVIQFGEGNFLRGFIDWMINKMNNQGLFNGRVVIAQPRGDKYVKVFSEQDSLYTLLLRGLQDGKATEYKEVISSVSRCISPLTQWNDYLKCAENPDIEFVVSNTTEAGIVFNAADKLTDEPPASFPGKLTVYLYHRYKHFNGDAAKGMVIIPCELIERNGEVLREIVLKLADLWQLPAAFKAWVKDNNQFLSTLVDRVVTGYPKDEIKEITAQLGYEDNLLDAGEIFHLMVIEGPKELAEKLPFINVGLNVIWTEDMTPYRKRKVRILNGAHTSSVPAAFLYGLETVGEMMDHEVLGKYVRSIIAEEIIPSIDLDKEMLKEFADAVVERFQNPFIKHYLLSILLNSASKFKARVLPSILEYLKLQGELPEKLTFSLAALLAVYKDGIIKDGAMQAKRAAGEFIMKDDMSVLEFMSKTWAGYDGSAAGAEKVSRQVLANTAMWGQDLNQTPGLTAKVGSYLYQITSKGMKAVVDELVG